MSYTIAQASRIGGRQINQDRVAWLATDDAVLMVVADGMGGHLQGEVAAQIAVDTVIERFRGEATTRLPDPALFLRASLRQAHETIVRYAADCRIPFHAAPRTTCIACVVQGGQAIWAHAGDSRLYLIHRHGSGQTRGAHTRDHSVVQQLIDAGRLSHADAASHPLRNRVFNCLGGDATPYIEVSKAVPLEDGDLLALCTDGVWAPLGDALVSELGRAALTNSVPNLLSAAERLAGPGADNLTLIAMRWDASATAASLRQPTPATQPKAPAAPLSDGEVAGAVAELRRSVPHVPNGAA